MKRWYGKLLGFFAGAALFRTNPLFGALVGLLIGHAFDIDWFRLRRDNPYAALGLTSDATDAEVDQAYRRLISQYHPDRVAGAAARAAPAGRGQGARDQPGLRPHQDPAPAPLTDSPLPLAGEGRGEGQGQRPPIAPPRAADRQYIRSTRTPMQSTVIAPSILSANFARLGEEVDNVLAAGADWVHFDVMDNHYVPNLTIGPMVCEALRKHGVTAPIDVHLMVQPVDRIVPDFAKAGASVISFHPEASAHVHRTVQLIKSHGCQAGLVLNPATPIEVLDWVLDDLDLVLLMSVNPGFGGQSFIPSALDKLRRVRAMIDRSGKPIRLEIDGGVKADNIAEIAAAGADTFVAGSAIFNAPDYADVIGKMKAAVSGATSDEHLRPVRSA